MADNITVREALLSDSALLANNNIAMAFESEGKKLNRGLIEEGVRQAISDPNKATYYIAEIDGEFAGQTMVTTEWSDWRNGWFWWIQSVYTAPAYRRRGVYRKIYEHIKERAKQVGNVCGIRLYVERENGIAIKAYDNLGNGRCGYVLMEEDWSEPADE